MTTGLNRHEKRKRRGVLLIAVAVAALSGCATASLEDAAPTTAAIDATLPEQTVAVPTPTPLAGGTGAGASGPAAASVESATVTDADIPAAGITAPARQTGQYPNLNIVPTAAAPQLTAAERNAKLAELAAAQRQAVRGASGKPTANEAKLKKLAKTHAQSALKEIEGQ